MKPQDVVEEATHNLYVAIITKILNNAHATNPIRLVASEEAKTLIGEQVASTSTKNTYLYSI